MGAVPQVVKGYFKASLSGTTLTYSAQGVTKVRFPKQGTIGDFVTLDLTGKSYTFNPAAYPDSMTNGITDAVNWGSAMPWFDYLVNIDNTAANVIMASSRDPRKSTISAHANVDFSDGLASGGQAQGNTVAWAAHAAGIDGQPCTLIGSHTQTYSYGGVGAREWVIGALAATDGFGKFQSNVVFVNPVGQNGNEANKHFTSEDGATSLAFTTDTSNYMIDASTGMVTWVNYQSSCSANGADNTDIRFAAPVAPLTITSNAPWIGNGLLYNSTEVLGIPRMYSNGTYATVFAAAGTAWHDNGFTGAGNCYIWFTLVYKAF